jgi:enterochelin esterase-like enzyme
MQEMDFQRIAFSSRFLNRQVCIDLYVSDTGVKTGKADLLLLNDGQDLITMQFSDILKQHKSAVPLIAIGVHAGAERKQEYGVVGYPDYMGRGAKAGLYASFVLEELLPFVKARYQGLIFSNKYLAGFSLGGLMAFDMLLDNPHLFSAVGVFSGSFWWRSKDLEKGYIEELDRIMHAKTRTKNKVGEHRFFIQTGQLDEKADRNKNGIIDSIDDALGIIDELIKLGYNTNQHINYVELPDGKHDITTWGKMMPEFLNWLDRQQ